MKMTTEEFKSKYGFSAPYDARDRDMVIMSDLQHMVGYESVEVMTERMNAIKRYILDTQGMV